MNVIDAVSWLKPGRDMRHHLTAQLGHPDLHKIIKQFTSMMKAQIKIKKPH